MKPPMKYFLVLSTLVNLLLIFIHSDSGAQIAALGRTITEWALVGKGVQLLEELSGSHKITLVWMPSHHVILGNEEGEKSVKEGTNKVPSDQPAGIPFAVGEVI
jgi:hypothetical protein